MVEALGSTEAGRASTDNENVDVAANEKSRVSLVVLGLIDKHKSIGNVHVSHCCGLLSS